MPKGAPPITSNHGDELWLRKGLVPDVRVGSSAPRPTLIDRVMESSSVQQEVESAPSPSPHQSSNCTQRARSNASAPSAISRTTSAASRGACTSPTACPA